MAVEGQAREERKRTRVLATASKRRHGLAVGKIIAIPNYANVMVGERRMHLRQRALRHVTAHTVAGSDRAATPREVSGGGETTRSDMTGQAFGVIGRRGGLEWSVRVVTRNASDARINEGEPQSEHTSHSIDVRDVHEAEKPWEVKLVKFVTLT